MPELPEVESLRLSLEPYLVNQIILQVDVLKPKVVCGIGTARQVVQSKVDEFIEELQGEIFESVERRAKNLIFKFKSGKILLAHLKMTGQFLYKRNDGEAVYGGHPILDLNKHVCVRFKLNKGELIYNDVRMFGYLIYYSSMNILLNNNHFDKLGVEPLGSQFAVRFLDEVRGVLKSVLLSQSVVVGLGNIYVDEVCFEARVRPDRRVESLTVDEKQKIFLAIKKILKLAVEAGGSSVSTYLMADGKSGKYAHQHKVYMKGGKPCCECGSVLEKMKLSGRTTVFCFNCQK